MKRVSIRQAMIDAIEMTDENLGRYPAQMMKWAKYIEKEIGSKLGYKVKSKSFILNGCSFNLPDDCYRPISILMGNWEDKCNAQYANSDLYLFNVDTIEDADVYGRDLTKIWTPIEYDWMFSGEWEEVGNQIQMKDKFTNTEVTLLYNYIETDEKGYWIVNESHIDAISKFIAYKYSLKFKWKIFKSDKLLRQGHLLTIEELKNDYNTAIRNARAEDSGQTLYEVN